MKTKIMWQLCIILIIIVCQYITAQSSITKINPKTNELIVGKTEVRYWDSLRAQNGYTLFAGSGKTYLIDMQGYVVHQWNLGTNPRFVGNGHILDATRADPSGFTGFKEVDWDGNTVWQYTETRTTYAPHHDWTRIYNKKLNAYTTLYIANKSVTSAQALAAGCNPANGPYTNVQLDAIVEVDMSGNIVWEWWFFDHIIQDYDATKPNYVGSGKTIANYPNKININMPGKPLRKDWLHCNSIDYNDSLDQIVINSVHGEFYIIDHGNTFLPGNPSGSVALAATSAGDFMYRFGDPARYSQGDPPSILSDWTTSTTGNKQIGGSHDVHWIKPGLPGAGNIQIFNNGEYLFERVSQSYIFELNPFYDSTRISTGSYVNPPAAGYYNWIYPNRDAMKQNKLISKQVVWIYCSKNDQNFFSTIGGSEQRLSNGNTFICSDSQGHLFEVTKADTVIVWEYINPVTSDGIKTVITDQYPMYNSVFRAARVLASDPNLTGRSLNRIGTITGRTPDYLTPDNSQLSVDGSLTSENSFALNPNYPNPFNPSTTISFTLSSPELVTMKIYNSLGKEVATLVNESLAGGTHSYQWDAKNLQSGIYFCQVIAGSSKKSMKMLFLK